MDLHEQLPVGNYTVKYDKMQSRFYLDQIESFSNKGKVYGDTMQSVHRVLKTFESRPSSTGVMLNGEKGSGKTLMAKLLSSTAAEQGIPTIVINAPWCGEEFNMFMQMIEQPIVILFDEFEKVYDKDDQEKLLTLLDGVYPSKKLFVLTCNDKWRVDSHMRNRPGRIFYMLDYKGLDQEFIIEYCEDNLNNKTHISTICKIGMMFAQFNFDMLKALVEEMNRFNETPQESMKMLNAKPEFAGACKYSITLTPNGKDIDPKHITTKEWSGNPLSDDIDIEFKAYEEKIAEGETELDWNWDSCAFKQRDLQKIDSKTGKFIFLNEDGDRLMLSKMEDRKFHYYDAF